MPRRSTSGIRGLIKKHVQGCARPARLERCGCAWYGRHKGHLVALHAWAGTAVGPHDKTAAAVVFTRLKKAIDEQTFDRAGERRTTTGGQSLKEFIADWWIDHVEPNGLNPDGLKAQCAVLSAGTLGERALHDLAHDSDGIERWLQRTRKIRHWKAGTFNEYRRLLRQLFQRAVDRKKVPFNPIHAVARLKGDDQQRGELRHQRLTRDDIEARLLAACDTLTHGTEMRRRVLAAFDWGARAGELATMQLKHVDWAHPLPEQDDQGPFVGYRIVLPAPLTKGGKTTGEDEVLYACTRRSAAMLEARRDQFRDTIRQFEAYLFGTESGYRVQSFKKSWHALFTAAGLTYGRAVGLTWHTIRHEYCSRVVELAARHGRTLADAQDLTRHRQLATLERYVHTRQGVARELARGL